MYLYVTQVLPIMSHLNVFTLKYFFLYIKYFDLLDSIDIVSIVDSLKLE